MFVIIWKFEAHPEKIAEFEAAYGPGGEWVVFFQSGEGYLATELLKEEAGTYLTIDRWITAAHYRRFREENGDRYLEIDLRCESLTIREMKIGEFEPVE